MCINHARNSSPELNRVPHLCEKPAARRIARHAQLVLLLVALSILAACGPEKSNSKPDQLEEETIHIAQTYVQDGDSDRARLNLQMLDVANPMQWLVFQAETAITDDANAVETQALAALAIGLGSQSHAILEFGSKTGVVPADDGNADEVQNTEGASAVQLAESIQETPAALPTVAVIPLEPTEATTASDSTPASSDADDPVVTATSTPEPAADEPVPTATSIPVPQVVASTSMNVRSGPGTVYPIVGDMGSGEAANIVAKNAQSDWWQVKLDDEQLGWVFGQLVETRGDLGDIAVASDIPEPPAPTPAPVVEAPPEESQPVEEAPPAEEAAPPPSDGPDFRVIEKRLWDVYENGGSLSGPTVTCGEKRQLVVNVVDANGSRINGVAVQEEFGAKEIQVTGAQGKGDGTAEFILGRGQDVRVVRDSDGRDVTSEVARGMVTEPAGIPYEVLKAGQYCPDDASCKKFVDAPGCWGHYSWTVTFQRNY